MYPLAIVVRGGANQKCLAPKVFLNSMNLPRLTLNRQVKPLTFIFVFLLSSVASADITGTALVEELARGLVEKESA